MFKPDKHDSAFLQTARGDIWRVWFDGNLHRAPCLERLTPFQCTEHREAIAAMTDFSAPKQTEASR